MEDKFSTLINQIENLMDQERHNHRCVSSLSTALRNLVQARADASRFDFLLATPPTRAAKSYAQIQAMAQDSSLAEWAPTQLTPEPCRIDPVIIERWEAAGMPGCDD